jgi:hypothetical protein
MAKRKTAVTKTAKPVAKSNKKATNTAAASSPAPAPKKAAKTPKKKVVQKPPLETKTVCFTDKDSGKKFCGEMTEVPPSKETAKVAGTKKRAALRRRKR